MPNRICEQPGCDRPAGRSVVAPSQWEDAASESAILVCHEHMPLYGDLSSGALQSSRDGRRRRAA
jgi:hypothetical protein